jgi:hypothetical protein
MADVTYFVALPFVAGDDGVAAGDPTECFNPTAVVIRAEALSRKSGHIGAVAFSRTGDPATGDFGDAKIIKKFGEVPDDLSTLQECKLMAEDEETATARYIAGNVSTQLMLKTLFEIIATMADDPDRYRSDMRRKLLELADAMPLAPMSGAREKKVRGFVRETVGNLLINQLPN